MVTRVADIVLVLCQTRSIEATFFTGRSHHPCHTPGAPSIHQRGPNIRTGEGRVVFPVLLNQISVSISLPQPRRCRDESIPFMYRKLWKYGRVTQLYTESRR